MKRMLGRSVLFIIVYFIQPLLGFVISIFAKKRACFEKKNLSSKIDWRGDLAIEVSSEGELEQILYLIEDLISEGLKIELFYCSDSVEHKVLKLMEKYPNHFIGYRLPLVSSNPFIRPLFFQRLVTAETFLMVRYDFFPDLLFYASNPKVKSYLLSATLRNKNSSFSKLIMKTIFSVFDKIYISSRAEDKKFKELGVEVEGDLDLRVLQIISRQKNLSDEHRTFLSQIDKKKTHVLGSAYLEDLVIITDAYLEFLKENEVQLYIYPHHLDEENIIGFKEFFNNKFDMQLISTLETPLNDAPIKIVTVKGLLCEFYEFSDKAYIGGGFENSIHSVLEPYLGQNLILTGPGTHRSTEYLNIKHESPNSLYKCSSRKDVTEHLIETKNDFILPDLANQMSDRYNILKEEVLRGAN